MSRGMPARALGPADSARVNVGSISVPFVISVQTVAGTATYTIYNSNAPNGLRVIQAWGYMTGAGAGGDTCVVRQGSNAITNTADLSAMSDTDQWDFGQIDNAYNEIPKGGSLSVVTASDALTKVFIECEWLD